MKKRIINLLIRKVIPLWIVLLLILNSSMAVGIVEYYLMKKNFNTYILQLSKTTKSPEELVRVLKQEVLPQNGYTLAVTWGDIGQQLLQSGVIDQVKYKQTQHKQQVSDY